MPTKAPGLSRKKLKFRRTKFKGANDLQECNVKAFERTKSKAKHKDLRTEPKVAKLKDRGISIKTCDLDYLKCMHISFSSYPYLAANPLVSF